MKNMRDGVTPLTNLSLSEPSLSRATPFHSSPVSQKLQWFSVFRWQDFGRLKHYIILISLAPLQSSEKKKKEEIFLIKGFFIELLLFSHLLPARMRTQFISKQKREEEEEEEMKKEKYFMKEERRASGMELTSQASQRELCKKNIFRFNNCFKAEKRTVCNTQPQPQQLVSLIFAPLIHFRWLICERQSLISFENNYS